jgi:hypothetical protein
VPIELTLTFMEGVNAIIDINIIVETTGLANKSYTSDESGEIVISSLDGYTDKSITIILTGDLVY